VILQRRTELETRTVRRKTTKKKKIKQGTVGDYKVARGCLRQQSIFEKWQK
jgi:hypothetical protein